MLTPGVFHKVLSCFPDLIPGIEQVVLIHYQNNTSDIAGYLLQKEDGEYKTTPIRIDARASIFSDYSGSGPSFTWFSKNQLPFEIQSKDKIQLTIFSELKNSVLLVKYSSSANDSDLYFIYFNENLSNFLLEKVSEPLSAQHKNMVGFLLTNSIRTLYQILDNQQQITQAFDEQIRHIIHERDELNEKLCQSDKKERDGILSLVNAYLSRFAKQYGIKAVLTDSAKIKLRSYSGELFQIEEVVRNALDFAGALYTPSESTPLLIADYHIRFPEPLQQKISEEVIEGLPQRLVKTHLLLDRLELAATGIKQRKENLTSANVGKEFPTPISAPAISDALRKHKKRIIQLFDRYPDKWEIIRHEFRPIQNLLSSALPDELLSA